MICVVFPVKNAEPRWLKDLTSNRDAGILYFLADHTACQETQTDARWKHCKKVMLARAFNRQMRA